MADNRIYNRTYKKSVSKQIKQTKQIDTPYKRGQMIVLMICLSFLFGVVGGSIAAQVAGMRAEQEVAQTLQTYFSLGDAQSMSAVFLKHAKYIVLIWLGGFLSFGVFLSVCVCLFRAISLGFTSGMLMAGYGFKGVWLVVVGVLPQQFLFVPACVGMTVCAIYYLFAWQEEGIRPKARRQDQKRKRLEYLILLCACLFLTMIGSIWETMISPYLLQYLGGI